MKIKSLIFVSLLWSSSQVQAGIPVLDSANLAQAIEQVTAWAQQAQQMESQLQRLQQQYQNLTGIRNMGSLVNNPALRTYMPAQYQGALTAAGGFGNQNAIQNANTLFNLANTSLSGNSNQVKAYNNNFSQISLNRALAESGYNNAGNQYANIQVLLDKVNDAPDAKDIADLQARIQAEQAMLQNEANKLAALKQLQQAQTDLANQQSIQLGIQSMHGAMPAGY